MAAWTKIDAKDLVPPQLRQFITNIQKLLDPIQVVLQLLQTTLDLVKVFLLAVANPLLALAQAVVTEIENFLKNLLGSGLYVLYDIPDWSEIPDPKTLKFNYAGGSKRFKNRVIQSFFDPFDNNKPAFTNDATVGGIVFAVDAEDIVLWITLAKSIINIFTDRNAAGLGALPPPRSVAVSPGTKDGNVKKGIVTVRFKDEWSTLVTSFGGFIIEVLRKSPAERIKTTTTKSTDPKHPGTTVPVVDSRGQPVLDDTLIFPPIQVPANILSPNYEVEIDFNVKAPNMLGSPAYIRVKSQSAFTPDTGKPSVESAVVVPAADRDLTLPTSLKIVGGSGPFKLTKGMNNLRIGTWVEQGSLPQKVIDKISGSPTTTNNSVTGNYLHRKTIFEAEALPTGDGVTVDAIVTYWNQSAKARGTVGAANDGGKLTFFVRNPVPNQTIALSTAENGSAHKVLQLGNSASVAAFVGPKPDWNRVAVQDIFPFLVDAFRLLIDTLHGLIDGFRSIIENVINFIDLVKMRIKQLQDLIDQLNAILEFLKNLFLGTFFQLVIPPKAGGSNGFINDFATATNGPISGPAGITGGIVLLIGSATPGGATDAFKALSTIFGIH